MRSKNLTVISLTLALLYGLAAPPLGAEFCTIDAVPAATLLLPYFEVDFSRRGNVTTVFSIVNLGAAPALAHVTLWTDWAVPTHSFDIYLTGFDVETIDLRDIFVDGELPPSAGSFCEGAAEELSDDEIERLQNAHTGRETGAGCVGHDHGDRIARGYVTIDNTNECSVLFPGETGYFQNGTGVASQLNALWGEYHITERRRRGMAAGELVAVEAEQPNGSAGYTFYGRYDGGTGTDIREPLGTVWAARYHDRIPFGRSRKGVDTDLIIWRDTTYSGLVESFECGQTPPWYPINETQVVAFDEEENGVELCGVFEDEEMNLQDPVCAPLATQRVRLGDGDLDVPFDAGWLYLNLNHTGGGSGSVDFNGLAQSFVTTLIDASGLRGDVPGSVLANACGRINGDLN